jgi:predicted RNA-binding Zn-ribbon protein involved in translation (DUF1610 family)
MAGWERQGQNAVKITRAVRPPQGSMFVAASRNRADKYDDKRISTQMKTGRLRVVRTGNVLFYFAAKDASDEFELLYQTTFNMDDLDNVRVLVLSGDREASFDVRIRELTIRADALVPGPVEPPQLPQPPPAIINQIGPGGLAPQPGPLILGPDGRLLTTVLPQDVGNVTPPRSEPPATASRGWLLAMLVIGALLILGFVLSVVGWLFLRRRALTVARPAASGQTVSFVCPQCGKALKTRVALAGKKVKCVKCGKSVPVPLSEPDDADIPVV